MSDSDSKPADSQAEKCSVWPQTDTATGNQYYSQVTRGADGTVLHASFSITAPGGESTGYLPKWWGYQRDSSGVSTEVDKGTAESQEPTHTVAWQDCGPGRKGDMSTKEFESEKGKEGSMVSRIWRLVELESKPESKDDLLAGMMDMNPALPTSS